jgi:hypothetical protein
VDAVRTDKPSQGRQFTEVMGPAIIGWERSRSRQGQTRQAEHGDNGPDMDWMGRNRVQRHGRRGWIRRGAVSAAMGVDGNGWEAPRQAWIVTMGTDGSAGSGP